MLTANQNKTQSEILVDDRTGSKELARLFHLRTAISRLSFGDFSFLGNGPDGPVAIGIERKAIRDLLQSMQSGRFSSHQLPGLINSYFTSYVIIEGIWSSCYETGFIMVPDYKGKGGKEGKGGWVRLSLGTFEFRSSQLYGFINSISLCGGVIVMFTRTQHETVRCVESLHSWWMKPWKDHRSHMALRTESPTVVQLATPSLTRKLASQLPGVGWKRSGAVDRHFRSPSEMLNATEKEWAKIEGIGKGIASSIVSALHKERESGEGKKR